MKLEITKEQDIETLIQLRIDFLRTDKGFLSEEDEEIIRSKTRQYLEKHIAFKGFMAVVAKENNEIRSAAFLLIQERPANTTFISGITGTLFNVITYPEFRKKGIATQVIQHLISEAKKVGVTSIDLLSSEEGKSVYTKLGFKKPSYTAMRLKL